MLAISSMFSSKSPSVDGLVSIRPAVVSSTLGRRSSTSMFPRRSVCTGVSSPPLTLAALREVRAHEHQPRELALRPRRRLQGDRLEPRDLGERLLQLEAE